MDDIARDASPAVAEEPKRHSFLADLFIRLVKEKPLGTIGGIIVLILLLTGIFAEALAPYGYNENLGAYRAPPSPEYVLGTDNLG
ncbi:unnamed protein product, partial [marine sediment metagenome]